LTQRLWPFDFLVPSCEGWRHVVFFSEWWERIDLFLFFLQLSLLILLTLRRRKELKVCLLNIDSQKLMSEFLVQFIDALLWLNLDWFPEGLDLWSYILVLLILSLDLHFILNLYSCRSSWSASSDNGIWIWVFISSFWDELWLEWRYILLLLLRSIVCQFLLIDFLSIIEWQIAHCLIDLGSEGTFKFLVLFILLSQHIDSVISLTNLSLDLHVESLGSQWAKRRRWLIHFNVLFLLLLSLHFLKMELKPLFSLV
jgi:hypothetical protein